MRNSQGGRWAWWAAPLVAAGLGWLLWSKAVEPSAAAAAVDTRNTGASTAQTITGRAAGAQAAGASHPGGLPLAFAADSASAAAALLAREAQHKLWQMRLERAQASLDAYRQQTRYPHESRPIGEHPDQVYPNRPVSEEHALRGNDGKPIAGVKLQTTQERIFAQGPETVRFTVAVKDEEGKAQPLRVLRASARELPRPTVASNFPVIELPFTDDGQGQDAQAGDQVFSALLQPQRQGFATLAGGIRVEVYLEYRGQQGMSYFDVFYTPAVPATWTGGVRETLADGSLDFFLKADVKEAGRYVVTARVDDASGKPFALLTFNEEVAAGPQEFKLEVFGKLVRDSKPAFPLTLRDVDGFLLRPDAFPDRSLMPRLQGKVYTSASYALQQFSDAEWSSEERLRYLAELSKDVTQAKAQVDPPPGP